MRTFGVSSARARACAQLIQPSEPHAAGKRHFVAMANRKLKRPPPFDVCCARRVEARRRRRLPFERANYITASQRESPQSSSHQAGEMTRQTNKKRRKRIYQCREPKKRQFSPVRLCLRVLKAALTQNFLFSAVVTATTMLRGRAAVCSCENDKIQMPRVISFWM